MVDLVRGFAGGPASGHGRKGEIYGGKTSKEGRKLVCHLHFFRKETRAKRRGYACMAAGWLAAMHTHGCGRISIGRLGKIARETRQRLYVNYWCFALYLLELHCVWN